MKRIAAMAAVLVLAFTGSVFGQGVQTGSIRGVVKDAQGLVVPGVTITATSPALQGPRVAVTDTEGAFSVAALPAGDYTVTYELSGFTTTTRKIVVPVGSTVYETVALTAAGIAESINVVGQTPAVITSPVAELLISVKGCVPQNAHVGCCFRFKKPKYPENPPRSSAPVCAHTPPVANQFHMCSDPSG